MIKMKNNSIIIAIKKKQVTDIFLTSLIFAYFIVTHWIVLFLQSTTNDMKQTEKGSTNL